MTGGASSNPGRHGPRLRGAERILEAQFHASLKLPIPVSSPWAASGTAVAALGTSAFGTWDTSHGTTLVLLVWK